MVQPVNLNRFRKQKTRAADKLRADDKAVRHGRGRSEKEAARALIEKARRNLDGHKRD